MAWDDDNDKLNPVCNIHAQYTSWIYNAFCFEFSLWIDPEKYSIENFILVNISKNFSNQKNIIWNYQDYDIIAYREYKYLVNSFLNLEHKETNLLHWNFCFFVRFIVHPAVNWSSKWELLPLKEFKFSI